MKKSLRERVKKGEILFGQSCLTGSTENIEIAGLAGFDFIFLDREHHVFRGWDNLKQMIQAADAVDVSCIVRVEAINPSIITAALNIGAQGIMVPHLCTKEQAESLVKLCRLPPEGFRNIEASTRAGSFGFGIANWSDYMKKKNEEVLVGCMIEDKEAVENIDEILSVKGLDYVCFGSWDYSISMGLIGQPQHPEVLKAFDAVIEKSLSHGVAVYKTIDPIYEEAKKMVDKKVTLICLGEDIEIYANLCKDMMKNIVNRFR